MRDHADFNRTRCGSKKRKRWNQGWTPVTPGASWRCHRGSPTRRILEPCAALRVADRRSAFRPLAVGGGIKRRPLGVLSHTSTCFLRTNRG